MNNLLKLAITERKELQARLDALDKVIELLGGNVEKSTRRKHDDTTREKMKEAWKRRKQKQPPTEESGHADDGNS